jgi:hypothetical protein
MERDGGKRDEQGEGASTSARCSGPLTSLDLNYMQELVSQRQRGRGGRRPAPNLFTRKSRSVEVEGVGIVIEKRVLKKRVMVMPKAGRRKSNNLVEADSLWELVVGSFKSCCINVVLVEKGSMRDFLAPGAIVKYAVAKRGKAQAKKVKGVDFQLLGVLHSRPERIESQKKALLRAWARPYLSSKTTHIQSIEEGGLSSVELALVKARMVEIDEIQIHVVYAPPDQSCCGGKGAKSEKKRKREREAQQQQSSSYHVSLAFEVEDYTGRAKCRASHEVALDILKTIACGKWSAVVEFCGRISKFYERDCKIAIVKQPKSYEGVRYQLEMPSFVDLSYTVYKDFYRSTVDLCSYLRQSDALNFICRHGSSAGFGAGTGADHLRERDVPNLQVLHSEKPISLYECLKHSISW